jgi:hypothetical protein
MEMDEFSCWPSTKVKQKKDIMIISNIKKLVGILEGHVEIERWSLNQTHVFTIYQSSSMFTKNSIIFKITYPISYILIQ